MTDIPEGNGDIRPPRYDFALVLDAQIMNDGGLLDLGKTIRTEREKKQLSQFRLARLLGISHGKLSSWERGDATPAPGEAAHALRTIAELEAHISSGAVSLARKDRPSRGKTRVPPLIPLADVCDDVVWKPSGLPVAVSLFSGGGGFSLGALQAGFEIAGHIEIDRGLRQIFRANFPNAECICHDITTLDHGAISAWSNRIPKLDLLIGGPPCQGFSLAGKRDVSDPRNLLALQAIRVAHIWRPRIVILENVRLMLSMRTPDGGLVLDSVVHALTDAGYTASYFALNARDYGVPQFRERVFVVGIRSDLSDRAVTAPPATHRDGAELDSMTLWPDETGPKPYVTFRAATADLPALEAGEWSDDPLHWAVDHPRDVVEMLLDVPEGGSAHDHAAPERRPKSGYNTTYKRIVWDEPCSTIGTTFGMISASRNVHPSATRSLTVREAARCQTFPDRYVFGGQWGLVRTAIGNAVPPLLARTIIEHAFSSLRGRSVRR